MDFVPVEELQKVLGYVDSCIQGNCINFYRENGYSLTLLADHLRHLEKLANEALSVEDNDEIVEFWGDFEDHPITKADAHLRESLRSHFPQYAHWFIGGWAFGALQFAHKCRRLQQKLSTVNAEILNPSDELNALCENPDIEKLCEVIERNLDRRRKNSHDGSAFRHGLALGLTLLKQSTITDEHGRLRDILARVIQDNIELCRTNRKGR